MTERQRCLLFHVLNFVLANLDDLNENLEDVLEPVVTPAGHLHTYRRMSPFTEEEVEELRQELKLNE